MTISTAETHFPTRADFPLGKNPQAYCWRTLEWLKERHPTFVTDAAKAKELYEHALAELCTTYDAEGSEKLWARYRDRPLFVPPELEPTSDDFRLGAISDHGLARDRRESRKGRQVAWPGEWVDAGLRIPYRAWLTA